jgi:dienelactone hydrolase
MSLSRLAALGCLGLVWACSSSADSPGTQPIPGAGAPGTSGGTAGAAVGMSGSSAGGSSGAGGNGTAGAVAGGAGPTTGGGGAAAGGAAPLAGTSAGGAAGSGGDSPNNPGNYPDPPRDIMVTGTEKVSIGFAPSDADAQASGSQHYGEFDPTKKVQKKLVLPLGGVNSDPWRMGWAVDRGYHVLTVDLWNDYPKDAGYPEYLESWSGEDKSQTVNQNPANSVMARVKAGLNFLASNDPGSDWAYYLDGNKDVRWNDVIVFGYSFGGQMGVAASKYVAADRIVITSSPNVPIDSPWLALPAKTPGARCYVLGGNKDGEHKTHMDEAALLGWPGDVINVTHVAPPYASHRLEVDDGHSSFCGRPFNDGMIDWDSMCEFMFHTQK